MLRVGIILLALAVATGQTPQSREAQLLDLLNGLRRDPSAWAATLETQRRYYSGKLLSLPGQTPIMTNEGVRALDEAIPALRAVMKPLPPVALSDGLSQAAAAHVRDTGAHGLTGHTGSDGSTPGQRISRFGQWDVRVGENISYGPADPASVVWQLLIDDGVPGRGHRESLLDPQWRFVGIACGPHPTWRTTCVIDFAADYRERQAVP